MIESVFYEAAGHRIEVRLIPGPWWLWFQGVDNAVSYDGPLEYHGLHQSLEDCLQHVSCELLDVDDPDWVVSKDQRTPLRQP